MALIAGLACSVAGLLKLGLVTELLSKPIRYGHMNGIALTVLLSQLPKLLRISSFHPTVGAALDAYLEQHQVDWRP